MDAREKLMQILDKPVFPEGKDTLEAVTDYLLENDAVPVIRCRDCEYGEKCSHPNRIRCELTGYKNHVLDFCSYGERRDVHD